MKYAHSRTAPDIGRYTIDVINKRVTAEKLAFLFKRKRRHCYLRTSWGTGCLLWVQTLVQDVVNEGYISTASRDCRKFLSLKGIEKESGPDYYVAPGNGTFF